MFQVAQGYLFECVAGASAGQETDSSLSVSS